MAPIPRSTEPRAAASLTSPTGGVPPQRKVVSVLVGGQILGGIGMGATLSLGSLLAAQLSGSTAWSGMAATMSTLGAAVAAVPLARLAVARGRRISLSTGALIAGTGAVIAIASAPFRASRTDLSMNAAGALGGALAGPVLASMGYSGLRFLAMALVAVVVIWTALHARRTSVPPEPVDS